MEHIIQLRENKTIYRKLFMLIVLCGVIYVSSVIGITAKNRYTSEPRPFHGYITTTIRLFYINDGGITVDRYIPDECIINKSAYIMDVHLLFTVSTNTIFRQLVNGSTIHERQLNEGCQDFVYKPKFIITVNDFEKYMYTYFSDTAVENITAILQYSYIGMD